MKFWGEAALAALMLASCRETTPAGPAQGARPELFLLTALPLLWSEQFTLEPPASPAVEALERSYRLTPIDLPSQLPAGAMLLAAQPRALPAEELVTLDAWVRAGGRLLLLADPMLEWPSALPLGDKGRPPPAFADTGLLQHWGLRLDAPEERGPRQLELGGEKVLTASPGTLAGSGKPCTIEAFGLAARCRLGKGRAVVVADADFINLGPGGPDGPTERNLPAMLSQLTELSR